jgi:hypothetical protein
MTELVEFEVYCKRSEWALKVFKQGLVLRKEVRVS